MFESRRPASEAGGPRALQSCAQDFRPTDDVWDLLDRLDLSMFERSAAMQRGALEKGLLVRSATRDEQAAARRLP